MIELLGVFNKNGEPIGQIARNEIGTLPQGEYVMLAWVWIVNKKGQVLVQKRAAIKKTDPNMYDISVAGHLDLDENIMQCCKRETMEEIGLNVNVNDFIFLDKFISNSCKRICNTFVLKTNAKIKDLILKKDEVSKVKYLSYNKFKKFIYSKKFVGHPKEYKDWLIDQLKDYCTD